MYGILHYIPKNHLSTFIGALAAIPVPSPLRSFVVGTFARLAGVNLSEVAKPLSEFRSVAEFFTRDLKPGLRPIGEGIVSPVDGTLRSITKYSSPHAEQIKGKTYSIPELLGGQDDAASFEGGSILNLYLSPPDYHHVHAPIDGSITRMTYLPGHLWPVNDWALGSISDLFSKNERVVMFIETALGKLALVMVGATNVGKITLQFDPLVTNTGGRVRQSKAFPSPVSVRKGERLGTFHLGSTVILLADSSLSEHLKTPRKSGAIKLGQSLSENP